MSALIIEVEKFVFSFLSKNIHLDIESNLAIFKEPLWEQIKNIAFTPEKDDKTSKRSPDSEFPLQG